MQNVGNSSDPGPDTKKEDAEALADLLQGLPVEEVDTTQPGLPPAEEYVVYGPSNSRVISGPLGPAKYLGTRFTTWQEAKAYVENKYDLVKFWTFASRWMARIKCIK